MTHLTKRGFHLHPPQEHGGAGGQRPREEDALQQVENASSCLGPLRCWNVDNELVLCPPLSGVDLTYSPLRDHDSDFVDEEEEFKVWEVSGITPTQGLPSNRYQEAVTTGLTWITG